MRSSTLENERSHPRQQHLLEPPISMGSARSSAVVERGCSSVFLFVSSCFAFPPDGMICCLLSESCSSSRISTSCPGSGDGIGNITSAKEVVGLVVVAL